MLGKVWDFAVLAFLCLLIIIGAAATYVAVAALFIMECEALF